MALGAVNYPVPSQCEMANQAFGRTNCCQSNPFDAAHCDQPIPILQYQEEYQRYSLKAELQSGSLTFDQVIMEITASRPVQAGILWLLGGGHAVLLVGYVITPAGDQYVKVADPDTGGASLMRYADLVQSPDGAWKFSWFMIQPIAPAN